jgi:hypothetical protein
MYNETCIDCQKDIDKEEDIYYPAFLLCNECYLNKQNNQDREFKNKKKSEE